MADYSKRIAQIDQKIYELVLAKLEPGADVEAINAQIQELQDDKAALLGSGAQTFSRFYKKQ